MKQLYVVDFSNFAYRYKSVYRLSYKNELGLKISTSILFGIARTVEQAPFNDILLIIDGYPQTFSSLLPSYKGQRSRESDETLSVPISDCLSFAYHYAKSLNKSVRVCCAPGQESDQVISSICHLTSPNKNPLYDNFSCSLDISQDPYLSRTFTSFWTPKNTEFTADEVVVGTTDSDMYQLLQLPHVRISSKINGTEPYTKTTPAAVHHLPPGCIPAYKAICGDISDNVPKVTSIKTSTVIDIIRGHLDTPSKFSLFLRELKSGQLSNNPLILRLQKDVLPNLSQLLKNTQITTLSFYGKPIEVIPPDLKLEEFAAKTHLRI